MGYNEQINIHITGQIKTGNGDEYRLKQKLIAQIKAICLDYDLEVDERGKYHDVDEFYQD